MACFLTFPILAFCLSLCFVPTKQARRPAQDYAVFGQRKEFGCTFEDILYKTRKTNTPIWEEKPNHGIYINSEYNLSCTISPTKKDVHPHHALVGEAAKAQQIEDKVLDTRGWDLFKSEVNQSFVLILKDHTLNDVDPFISFLTAYNAETVKRQLEKKENISIESFLNEYNVEYTPRQNPAGLIIDLLHEIKLGARDNINVKLDPAAYLVTAYVDPPQLNVNNVKQGYEDLTKTRFQDHVGGVIQIYYENRLGYILLEPGYYNTYLMTPFAVVLMADGNSPHGEFIFGKNLNGITFTMGDPSNMYVVATYTKPTGVRKMVYYLGRSYCSFLDSTTKGDLLRSEHGIVSFDEHGLGYGHLSFNIKYPYSFLLGEWRIHPNELYPQLAYEYMDFHDCYSNKLSKTEKDALNEYSKFILLQPQHVIRKIQLLIDELFNTPAHTTRYDEFNQTLTALSDTYKLEKVVNAKMVITYPKPKNIITRLFTRT